MTETVHYFTFSKKTAFMHLKYVYPECFILRTDHPATEALQCLTDSCPANRSCMEILAKKVHYLFEHVFPECELLLLYFRNEKGSIRAGVFHKDLREPYVMTCNRSGFAKCQTEGTVFSWVPTTDFLLLAPQPGLIVIPTSLVRRS